MVIEDLSYSSQSSKRSSDFYPATAFERFLSGVFDCLLLSPLVAFVAAFHLKEVRVEMAQGFDSGLWLQMAFVVFLFFIVLQAFFLYFFKATPGQTIFNLRVKSISSEKLSWNQCLLRSLFYTLSLFFMGWPFLEVFTHPVKRCLHDRVSDTLVIDLKGPQPSPFRPVNPQGVRALMIMGFFFMVAIFSSWIVSFDDMKLAATSTGSDNLDTLVARALLKKDRGEETQLVIDEKLWNARTSTDKAVAYFYRFKNEKEEEVKKALSSQICAWEARSLCSLTKYFLDPEKNPLMSLELPEQNRMLLSARVALMQEMTKTAHLAKAFDYYEKLKKENDIQDELKMWDVSLFIKAKAEAEQKNRSPASVDLKKSVAEYEKERGEP